MGKANEKRKMGKVKKSKRWESEWTRGQKGKPPHMDSSVVFAGMRHCAPPRNTCFLWPNRVQIPNGISYRFSLFFAQLTAERPHTLQQAAVTPSPHLHGSLDPPESSTKKACQSVLPFSARLTTVTDRLRNHATWSVIIGLIYIRSTAMQTKMVQRENNMTL